MCQTKRNPSKRFQIAPFGYQKVKDGPWHKWDANVDVSQVFSMLWDSGDRWTAEESTNAEPFLPERVDLIHRHLYPECEE